MPGHRGLLELQEIMNHGPSKPKTLLAAGVLDLHVSLLGS